MVYSIVDVAGIPTDNQNPNNYWKVFKNRQVAARGGSIIGIPGKRLKPISAKALFHH